MYRLSHAQRRKRSTRRLAAEKSFKKRFYDVGLNEGNLRKCEQRWRELVQCRQIIDLGDLQRISFTASHAGHFRICLVHELGESSRRLGAGNRADKKGQWLRKFAPLVVQSIMKPL